MEARNKLSRATVGGGDGPVVTLTTHGSRAASCHVTIESIARGALRPSRLVLWVDDAAIYANPGPALSRLKARGLEINLVENFGPHTKYFPLVEAEHDFDVPAVTADDDIVYPRWWLSRIVDSWRQAPADVVAYRARRIQLAGDGLAPYGAWPFCSDTRPSSLNFATGVAGVIYPPAMLAALKHRGRAFLDHAPAADDVWLHYVALQEGVRIRQVESSPRHFPVIESTQSIGLKHANVTDGRNDVQIGRTYSASEIETLRAAAAKEARASIG